MTGRHHLGRRTAIAAACALLGLGVTGAGARAASFTSNPSSPRVGPTGGESVSFSGSTALLGTLTWSWNFGDGSSGSGQSPSHTYGAPGTFHVTLTVSNGVDPPETALGDVNAVADQAPAASFTFTPPAPTPGQRVTFKSTSTDPDGPISALAWDLNDDGTFGDGTTATVSRTFSTAGPHNVHLKVTDDLGATKTSSQTVTVNQPPVSSFTSAPLKPIEGDTVTFTSTSSDADGTIVSQKWDLNGDGAYDDATGATATRKFTTPGANPVGLRVTDDKGAFTTVTATVVVAANQKPVASFAFSPASPAAGDVVTFTSSSKDADGSVVKQEWDLDGDAVFDNATGATAKRSFHAGPHRVTLRVTDDRGAIATTFQTITVAAKAAPGGGSSTFNSTSPVVKPTPTKSGPSALSPFPIISLRGRLTRRGALIQGLEVLQLARGTRVEVRCLGRSCHFRKKVRIARARSSRVRFPEVQHSLRSGTLLQVFVTRPGLIGKYTSFRIRRGSTPKRRDRCLVPGAPHPTRCA